jgi:hypothetical protein
MIERVVGCGAGFAGDRTDPVVEPARSGLVHAVALERLAELAAPCRSCSADRVADRLLEQGESRPAAAQFSWAERRVGATPATTAHRSKML